MEKVLCTSSRSRHVTHPGATPSGARVVIIGSGFGGLTAAKKLKRADVDIKLIAKDHPPPVPAAAVPGGDRDHLRGEIAPPTRVVLRNNKNCQVLLGGVTTST